MVKPDVYLSIVSMVSFILPQLVLDHNILWQTTFVYFLGYLGFILPFSLPRITMLGFNRVFGYDYRLKWPLRLLFKSYMPLIIVLLFFAWNFRVRNIIGIPGFESSHPDAGVLYYIFTAGYFVFISLYLLYAKNSSKRLLIFVILLIFYGLYQAALGWRQGLFDVILFLAVLYQNKSRNLTKLLKTSLVAFVSSSIAITLVLASSFRERSFSFVGTWERFFGIKFLNTVVDWFVKIKHNDIFFNDFFIFELARLNMSTSKYHNHIIMGQTFVNGEARTGFGSIYMLLGSVGVFFAFLLIGLFYKVIWQVYRDFYNNVYCMILYALSIIILQRIVLEQLDIGVLIHLLSYVFFIVVFHISFKIIGIQSARIN